MIGARVLVAEDDPITARFVASLLQEKGYEVDVAEDGERACEVARATRPDLLLTDLVLPYRDGFDILRTLRTDPKTKNLRIILRRCATAKTTSFTPSRTVPTITW